LSKNKRSFIRESLKGLCPFKTRPSPSPLKERGTQGVRWIKNQLRSKIGGERK